MDDRGATRTGWRRLKWWHWLAAGLAMAATAVVLLVVTGRDDTSDATKACRAVLQAVDSGSDETLLAAVREQAPVARAAAAKDSSAQPVADAIEQMRADLEARRPWRSVVVLYQRCG